ncbi:MAG TPA: TMEM175 family protein [Planctomycetota bacterium]|nr:TMEM175 family protein [Planctomycetota bacterium]
MPNESLLPQRLRGERHFRWRGGAVSRVEALSDAVFALVLTLLAITLEVPKTSAEMSHLFWQFPAFGVCFVFLLWIWWEHFVFHRRFGFEDVAVVWLNGALLLCVVCFVYPMKFIATMLVADPMADTRTVTLDASGPVVMLMFSGSFVGIFVVFTALYLLALRRAGEVGLDAVEHELARGSLRGHVCSVAIGAASLALLLTLPPRTGMPVAGFVYFLMGPVHAWNGMRTGRRVARMTRAAA